MAQVSGTGTTWNLPNYSGMLFTADAISTPFLTMIGGLTGGGKITSNFEFPTSSLYDFASAAQPAITETASLTAPTATEAIRTQNKNVCQIFQEQIILSYEKMANAGRLTGINTVGSTNNAPDELAFQTSWKLQKIARDVEYTFLNGAYQIATDAGTANKTRGVIASASTSTDASAAALSKTILQKLFRDMYDAGAFFRNPVIFVNSFQKQKISDIYGYAPEDRNIGGVNVNQIETDFGRIGVILDRFMPAASLLVSDMSVVAPVFQPVPGKGVLFTEELARTGAAVSYQMFGKIGLDHGPGFAHGVLTNLATS